MAQPPRKSSPGRKSTPPVSAEDLFGAASPVAPETDRTESFDDSTPKEWLVDDSIPAALPAKPISLPSGAPLPIPAALPGPASHLPDRRADSVPVAPAAKSPPPAQAKPEPEPIPEAQSLAWKPTKTDPPPASRTAEERDPFDINEELPPVPSFASSPAASLPPADELKSSKPRQTESSASPLPEEETLAKPPRQTAGRLFTAGILIALIALFVGVLYTNRPESDNGISRPAPRVPLNGQIAAVSAIDSGWRFRQPADLVSTVDVTLPVPSRQPSDLLPQVQFTLDPAATKTGFLRFIFLDPDRKISGDVRVVKVSGGTIDPLGSGAVVFPQGTATVYGSLGFMDRPGFVAYATAATRRWSVEISESADYNAKEEGWTKLETFDLRNASAP